MKIINKKKCFILNKINLFRDKLLHFTSVPDDRIIATHRLLTSVAVDRNCKQFFFFDKIKYIILVYDLLFINI